MSQWMRVGPSHYQAPGFDLERVGSYGSTRQWRLQGRSGTSYHQSINGARREARRHGVSEPKRRRRKENPSTAAILIIGGGVALLGAVAYFLFKSKSPQAGSQAPQLPPGRPLGDPGDSNSTAYACNIAFRLNAIGHPHEAAGWADKCTAGGGTVPATASQIYT